ncbi:MAG: DNA polymerase III subunit epsilon, partial [Alphaproteobacteria bacterium]|nr:DNA polymerase III subunit epsilon [Alphaproteobacteria bacterium]
AALMNDTLHAVGVPNCPGGVMAKNAPYRGSLETWRARVRRWIGRSNPQDLLSVDIFFDFRPVHGDLAMADAFWRSCWESVRGQPSFLKLLEQSSGDTSSPFGFLGRLGLDNGRIDLKLYGLKPVVTAARTLSLHHGVMERATAARIAGIRAAAQTHSSDFEAIEEAHKLFLTLIARQQVSDLASGGKAGNKVEYAKLSPATQEDLKNALRAVQIMPEIVRDRLTG